jgi:hypothetical protein
VRSVIQRFFVAVVSLVFCGGLHAQGVDWPQTLTVPEGVITVYQPQPEGLQGDLLTARAAMALDVTGSQDTIYGVFWFSAVVDTDRDADIARYSDFHITEVAWPDSKDAQEQRFTTVVENALEESKFTSSLSVLTASLTLSETVQRSLDGINNDPPDIIFRKQLAVLLNYDGSPGFSPIENSDYKRALNTPLTVVSDQHERNFYLTSGSLWYHANDALGPWVETDDIPDSLAAIAPKSDEAPPSRVPAIVTSTTPTELIVSDGKPRWDSLPGGEVMYVSNTETPWLRDLATGNIYVLLSGRWFRARSEAGPWTFVPADELPAGFSRIPPASDIGGLRTAIAGTEEADQAVVDAQIPQTAVIKRSEASLTVEYDGAPSFRKIDGTQVAYADNTGAQVLRIDGRYYAVDDGIWFAASDPKGPWVLADEIPQAEIAKIPPSSPVYNTTYVQVYDSTPEVVYVGYTPGYLWSFPYYGVPVYGTGWHYPPHWGAWYYPRPPTWGIHMGYNPWTGWNVGVSWGGPFLHVGVGWNAGWHGSYRPWGCCNGWYGGGYRRNDIDIDVGNINIGNTINVGNRAKVGNKAVKAGPRDNLYRREGNRNRKAVVPDKAAANLRPARINRDKANNIYADRDGHVYKRDNDNWQHRKDKQWQKPEARPSTVPQRPVDKTRPASRPATPDTTRPATLPQRPAEKTRPSSRPTTAPVVRPTTSPQFDRQQLNRDHQARNRGVSAQQVNRSRRRR